MEPCFDQEADFKLLPRQAHLVGRMRGPTPPWTADVQESSPFQAITDGDAWKGGQLRAQCRGHASMLPMRRMSPLSGGGEMRTDLSRDMTRELTCHMWNSAVELRHRC